MDPIIEHPAIPPESQDIHMSNTGDDGESGAEEDGPESDDEPLTEGEKKEEQRKLAEGAANSAKAKKLDGPDMAKIPPYILDYYKTLYPAFKRFWTTSGTFTRRQQKEYNKAIEDLISKHGDKSSQEVAALPFETFIDAKEDTLECFQEAEKMNKEDLSQAWLTADKRIMDMKQKLLLSGFPQEFGPPNDDWIERNIGLQRPGSKASSTSSAMDVHDEKWNPDAGDTIQELSRASGVQLLEATDGGVIGYSRRGCTWEVLVKEGKGTDIRYRMVSVLEVPTFNTSQPSGQNLTVGQRGAERNPKDGFRIWSAIHVVALKGVAWRRSEGDSDDPVKDMSVEQRTHPVTRVLIRWNDGKETWETRSTLRSIFPRQTADKMIYQRAGIQEARYRRGQGLEDWNFVRINLPADAIAFSAPSRYSGRSFKKAVSFDSDSEEEEEDVAPSRVSGRSSKSVKPASSRTSIDDDSEEEDPVSSRGSRFPKSIKTASSRTSIDDDSEEEDPVSSRGRGRSFNKSKKEQLFTKGQKAMLETMFQGMQQSLLAAISNSKKDRRRS